MQLLDPLNKRNCLVERIVTPLGRTGMATASLEGNAYLRASTVATINLHVRGFANDHVIRTNALVLDERITRDAVAPLFHIAKIIERPVFRQAQLLQCSQSIEHGRRGTLLITSAKTIDNAILILTFKGVPLPLTSITNPYGIDVAIVKQYASTITNTAQDIAHVIAAHLVKAKFAHTRARAITDRANLAVEAMDGHQVTQELAHGGMVLAKFLLHPILYFAYIHLHPLPKGL